MKGPEPTTVLQALNSAQSRSVRIHSTVLISVLVLLVVLFLWGIYSQRDVIDVFNQPIDTSSSKILEGAVLLGPLLSPTRIALVCAYPFLYNILGYSNPNTGYIIKTLVTMEPSNLRAIMALVLLQSGLHVDTSKTSPPTEVQEVINQIYPTDSFVPPNVIPPPSTPKQAATFFSTVLPQIMPLAMLAGMLL